MAALPGATRKRAIFFAGVCVLLFVLIFTATSLDSKRWTTGRPRTLAELLALKPDELEGIDIARMNLLCAEGLPGAEKLKVDGCLAVLDQWAAHAKREIDRHFYRFRAAPAEYENSEGYFRMLMMSVVVYEDLGIRYNPQRIVAPTAVHADDGFFADSRDVLLHGLAGERRMGTCSSMPVLYIALARRLGYPVRLVATKAHLFMRWDSRLDQFDMDATAKGMNRYNDEHYRQWPFPVSDDEIQANGYLKSMTAAEELSAFLSIRASCLMEAGRVPEAAAAFEAASQFAPEWESNRALLADAREKLARGWQPSAGFDRPPEHIDDFVRWTQMNRRTGPDPVPDPTPVVRILGPAQ